MTSSHAVVDEEAPTDGGAGVDFHAGEKARELGEDARREFQSAFPQDVGDAVGPDGVWPGVNDGVFDIATGCGVVVAGVGEVFADHRDDAIHGVQFYEKTPRASRNDAGVWRTGWSQLRMSSKSTVET